jgi:hypothetical protein
MSTALDLVYQYRQLAGKCEISGLSMDEIDLMNTIESLFRETAHHARQFAREQVSLTARVRGRGHVDTVRVNELAPGGVTCQRAPYLERDELVEVVIDDVECALSYRFKARVTWIEADKDGDDYTMGLQFVGQPVLLRYTVGKVPVVANAA